MLLMREKKGAIRFNDKYCLNVESAAIYDYSVENVWNLCLRWSLGAEENTTGGVLKIVKT